MIFNSDHIEPFANSQVMPYFVLRRLNLLSTLLQTDMEYEFPKQATTTKIPALKGRLLKTEGCCSFLWPTCDCFHLAPYQMTPAI